MISVILPTYNEAGNIKELISRTSKALKKGFEIIVVDDNSLDGTAEIVRKMQKSRPNLRLIVRQNEKGLPSAITAGIRQAKGETIAFFDSDLSMPPEKLPEMINLLRENEVISGSRFAKGGKDKRDFGYAKFFSQLINKMARIFLGGKITDYTSGFLVAKKEAVKGIVLKGSHGSFYMGFLYQAKNKGFKVAEVPYTYVSRKQGQSNIAGFGPYLKAGFSYLYKLLEVGLVARRELLWPDKQKNA